jgi:salicylate hydroxylase
MVDQGQGGAQAIEDAGALYTIFNGLVGQPTEKDIRDRLKLFETVRLKRASAIQVFSNAGQDEAEKVEQRAKPFMAEGQHIPKIPAEYMEHNFGYDVLKESEAWVGKLSAVAG